MKIDAEFKALTPPMSDQQRSDPDRAFRAALLPIPAPDHVLWQTEPHVVALTGYGEAPSYAEVATDGHRLHARLCEPPSSEAEPDTDAVRIRGMLEMLKTPTRDLTLSLADLRTMRRIQRELGKRWHAAVDLATGTAVAYHAGPKDRAPTARDLDRRDRVLGGPRLSDALDDWTPRRKAPACNVRYLLDAVSWTESRELRYGGPRDPICLSSRDGTRWAIVMPFLV